MIKHLSHYWFPLPNIYVRRPQMAKGKGGKGHLVSASEELRQGTGRNEQQKCEREKQEEARDMQLSDRAIKRRMRGKRRRQAGRRVCVRVGDGEEGVTNLASSLPNWGQIQLFAETTWKSLRIVPAGAPNLAAIALAALEGPFILEGKERLRRCTCVYVYVCVCVCVSSFILQGNEQRNEDAPGGDQIITHLGSERERFH